MTSRSEQERPLPTRPGDDMICVLDAEQCCLSVNGPFEDAFGVRAEELIGQHAGDAGGRASFATLLEMTAADTALDDAGHCQRWWDFPSLGFRYVRIIAEPIPGEDGDSGGTTIRIRDLTDARLAQEALEESEQRFEAFADIVDGWLWETDEELRFVYLSPRFETTMDMSRDEVLGRRRFESFPDEDRVGPDARRHELDLSERRPFDGYHFSRVLADGSKRIIDMSGQPVFDAQGRFRGYRGIARDVTESHGLRDRLDHLSSHDALTGLVNRHEFVQRLRRVIDTAGVDGSEHGLCYVDVDRFRMINDRCGHPAGDQLLMDLADVLGEQIRRRDTLARAGGNAFAILMEHCSLSQIERVAEAVRRAVGEYRFVRRDFTIDVAVSIGIVPIGADSRSVERVLKSADRACYAAKSAGGDRILVYGKPDRQAARERRGARSDPVA